MERTVRHPPDGEELMNGRSKSMLIEIPEEAYKQNSVYRPWGEIGQAPSTVSLSNIEVGSATPKAVTITEQKLALNFNWKGTPHQKRDTTP